MDEHIRNAKSFRNPDLLEKLVEYFDVRESGTNYPPELYDPDALAAHEYYDKLEEARRKYEERQARKPGQPVQFVGAGGGGGGGGGADDARARARAPTRWRPPPPPRAPAADLGRRRAEERSGGSAVITITYSATRPGERSGCIPVCASTPGRELRASRSMSRVCGESNL